MFCGPLASLWNSPFRPYNLVKKTHHTYIQNMWQMFFASVVAVRLALKYPFRWSKQPFRLLCMQHIIYNKFINTNRSIFSIVYVRQPDATWTESAVRVFLLFWFKKWIIQLVALYQGDRYAIKCKPQTNYMPYTLCTTNVSIWGYNENYSWIKKCTLYS